MQIGKYKVLRQLGAGGMGVVYVGEHERLGKSVAIKVITPQLSLDRQIIQRFFNEATAATRIHHPGIIEIFDYGEDEQTGSAYFVMELLAGEPLSARIAREGQMQPESIAQLGAQMADTLAAAHQAGIVHRDLKPDNIFLVPDRAVAGGVRVKILDFGIAKLISNQLEASSMTGTGAVMGTPSYMSPEQARGSSDSVDHRSDIYSLGCVLYHMASGRVPFSGQGLGEVLGAHLHVAPEPPRALAPQLPPQLDALILACLSKAPEERPESMHALCGVLEAMAPTINTTMGRGQARGAIPPGPARRSRWAVPAGIAAVVVAGAAIAVLAMSGDGKTAQPDSDAGPGAVADVAHQQDASSDETAVVSARDTELEDGKAGEQGKADEQDHTKPEVDLESTGQGSAKPSGKPSGKTSKMTRRERKARAAELNAEGKEVWLKEKDIPAAVKKFREATRLDPDATYYFNLCYALHQQGRFRQALRPCEQVIKRAKEKRLEDKARAVINDIRSRTNE